MWNSFLLPLKQKLFPLSLVPSTHTAIIVEVDCRFWEKCHHEPHFFHLSFSAAGTCWLVRQGVVTAFQGQRCIWRHLWHREKVWLLAGSSPRGKQWMLLLSQISPFSLVELRTKWLFRCQVYICSSCWHWLVGNRWEQWQKKIGSTHIHGCWILGCHSSWPWSITLMVTET